MNKLFYILGWPLLLAANVFSQTQEAPYAGRFGVNGLAQVVVAGQAFYIDSTGNRVFDAYENPDHPWEIPADDKNGEETDTTAYLVIRDGLKGLRSVQGRWILDPVYQQIEFLFKGIWRVTKAGQQTITSPTGDLLPYFDEVGYLNGRLFDVKTDGKWGLYDGESRQLVIPATYDGFDYCGGCGRKSDYVYAQQHGKWGVIDFNNNILVPFAYEHSHWGGMRSDVWVTSFTKNGKSLVVHIPSGKEFTVGNRKEQDVLSGSELVIAVNGKYGLIDSLCQEVLPPEYDGITIPNANHYLGYFGPYALVEKNGKKGIYESGRGLIIPTEWDDARVYDNYFVLSRNGQYGLYDPEGKELLTPGFTDITHTNDYFYSSGSNGISIFKTKQKALYGAFFPETGIEIPPQFHEIDLRSLADGGEATLIVGERQGETALFDLQGNELLPLGYDKWQSLDTTSLRYLRVGRHDLWGVYDTRLKKEVIPVRFRDVWLFAQRTPPLTSTAQVLVTSDEDDNRYGLYTLEGIEVLPPVYRAYGEVAGKTGVFSGDPENNKAILVDGQTGAKTQLPERYVTTVSHTNLLLLSDDSTQAQLYHPLEQRTVSDVKFAFKYSYVPDDRLATLSDFDTNGRAWVYIDGMYGLLDTAGRWVKKPLYSQVLPFDKRNVTVAAREYPDTDWRSHTRYIAYQFIRSDGQPVTDQVYTGPTEFLTGMDYFVGDYLAIRNVDSETGALTVGLVDTAGNEVLSPDYDGVEALNGNQYLLLQKDRKFGVANGKGDILLPVAFDNLLLDRYDKDTGFTFPVLGYKDGEWKYYTKDGKVLSVEGVGDKGWSVNTGWW